MSDFMMRSKLLNRTVEVEILPSFIFIEGVRYTYDDIELLKKMEPDDRIRFHVKRLLKVNDFREVTVI